ncbi:tRNA ligase [Sorochytrium milnesiophthora]
MATHTHALAAITAVLPRLNAEKEQQAVDALVKALHDAARGKDKKKRCMRGVQHVHPQSGVPLTSWIGVEFLYKRSPCPMPTLARGLFTRDVRLQPVAPPQATALGVMEDQVADGDHDNENDYDNDDDADGAADGNGQNFKAAFDAKAQYEIVVRGYDKFFNIGETRTTNYDWMRDNTHGPYEISVKENGCIIFISGVTVDGRHSLVITSKHSIGGRGDVKVSHAQKGEEWLYKHLASAGRTREELAKFLASNRLTAVFELADDDFEEHILAYPPDARGLYLHGLNLNTVEFRTLPSQVLPVFAQYFGTKVVDTIVTATLDESKAFTDRIRDEGVYKDRPVEGFVVRTRLGANVPADAASCADFLFKVKYDEPYLMFREWREVTARLLTAAAKDDKNVTIKPRYPLTAKYVKWVRGKMRTHPQWFAEYRRQKGIIFVRDQFLLETGATVASLAAAADAVIPSQPSGQFTTETPVLLLPIAVIGAGKTTLGNLLQHFFKGDVAQVQNDDMEGGGGGNKRSKTKNGGKSRGKRELFNSTIVDAFKERRIVMADRNNHLYDMREDITRRVKSQVASAVCVALHWDISGRESEVCALSVSRVDERGDRHQTLTPATPGYKGIVLGFVRQRHLYNAVNPHESDREIDASIEIDIFAAPEVTFQHVVTELNRLGLTNWTVPSVDAIHNALLKINPALISASPAASAARGSSAASKSSGRHSGRVPRYFAAEVKKSAVVAHLTAHAAGSTASDEFRRLWSAITQPKTSSKAGKRASQSSGHGSQGKKQAKRSVDDDVQPPLDVQLRDEHHVTLTFGGKEAATRSPDAAQVWERYMQTFCSSSKADADAIPERVVVHADHVIWDDKVVVMPVRVVDSQQQHQHQPDMAHLSLSAGTEDAEIPHAQRHLHITVAVCAGAKAVQSNELLERVYSSDASGNGNKSWQEEPIEPVTLTGTVRPYYH